jgi:dephospho-CoA kinase
MIVGLTGGIGSGKTTVANLFETMGCVIYNSDDKAKEVYFQSEVKRQVIELLGIEAYLNENEINKEYISKKVFSNTELLHQLNHIIHPAVKSDFILFKSKLPLGTIIIKESAILFETGIYKDLEKTILVTAPLEVKIDRVKKRNSTSEEDIKKRMSAQWTDEQKAPLANFVIVNDGIKALIPQVVTIIQQLKSNA